MAKSKRDIGAFQQAMLSNTKVIGNKDTTIDKSENKALAIDQKSMDKVLKISSTYGIEPSKVFELSVELFAAYEQLLFEKEG